MNWSILRVFISILGLAPARSGADFEFKWDVAEAIVNATEDPHEQDILVKIGWLESNFNRRVADCRVRGDKGKSLGIFQLQPISKYDYHDACGTVSEQASIAYRYVKRSYDACPSNTGADKLAMYVSGTCKRGIREAKNRWSE